QWSVKNSGVGEFKNSGVKNSLPPQLNNSDRRPLTTSSRHSVNQYRMPDVGDWRHTPEPLQKIFRAGKPEMAQVNTAKIGNADGAQRARRDLLERHYFMSIKFL